MLFISSYFIFYCSQTILIFGLKFWSGLKDNLIREIRLNFTMYDVTTWLKDIYSAHIDQYLKK